MDQPPQIQPPMQQPPQMQQPLSDPSRKGPPPWLLWLVAIIVLAPCIICSSCFGGCAIINGIIAGQHPTSSTTSGPTSAKSDSSESDSSTSDLKVSNLGGSHDEFVQFATGTVTNTGKSTYDYVQVEINLFDKSGAIVGSTIDNMTHLGPGQKWKFKAPFTETGVTKFQVKEVTGT